jgi:hypothetical protein
MRPTYHWAHPGTAPKFRAVVGRNAAFMRQSGARPDPCRINAAFVRLGASAHRRVKVPPWRGFPPDN